MFRAERYGQYHCYGCGYAEPSDQYFFLLEIYRFADIGRYESRCFGFLHDVLIISLKTIE